MIAQDETLTQKQVEQRALAFTTAANAIITLAGLWAWRTTGIQALFLDFFFSLVALVSTFAAGRISRISARTTKAFPRGLHFLEPLYSICKTLLIVTLLVWSVGKTGVTAYAWFSTGEGEVLNLSPVLPYTFTMFVLCTTVSIINLRANRSINGVSTMLSTEAKMNFIDGLRSGVIGVATFLLLLADPAGPFGFMYYTGDFFVTAILVAVTIKQPVSEIMDAFREIMGGTAKDEALVSFVKGIVERHLGDVGHECLVFKEGMFVEAVVEVRQLVDVDLHRRLVVERTRILAEVQTRYENCELRYELGHGKGNIPCP